MFRVTIMLTALYSSAALPQQPPHLPAADPGQLVAGYAAVQEYIANLFTQNTNLAGRVRRLSIENESLKGQIEQLQRQIVELKKNSPPDTVLPDVSSLPPATPEGAGSGK